MTGLCKGKVFHCCSNGQGLNLTRQPGALVLAQLSAEVARDPHSVLAGDIQDGGLYRGNSGLGCG